MNNKDDNEQVSDQPYISPKWLKIFLGLNLFALLALFMWEISAPALKSGEELEAERHLEIEAVQAVLSTNPEPVDRSGTLSPVIKYTVDATETGRWAHFSFAKGTVFYKEFVDKDSLDWDIAFRRAKVVTNGGATNPKGQAAVAAFDTDDFDSVKSAPLNGMVVDAIEVNVLEPKNPALDSWFAYDFWTHRLKPQKAVYAMRTADGHYAKFQLMDYYCLTISACYSFRYVYQGSGSRSFTQ